MAVSAQALAMIRRVTGGFLTETCTIEQEDVTTGQYGEPTHDWVVVAEDVACRLILVGQRYGSGIADAGAQETLREECRLIVPVATPLGKDMRVTVAGRVYQVVRIETGLTDDAFHSAILNRR